MLRCAPGSRPFFGALTWVPVNPEISSISVLRNGEAEPGRTMLSRWLGISYHAIMSNPHLAHRTCAPCRGGVPSLKGDDLTAIHEQLTDPKQWNIVNEHHIVRTYKFPDFKSALARSEERRVGKECRSR